MDWRKSSYSHQNGSCVEVAWRKSSYSSHNGSCVEVALAEPLVGVRDSKNTTARHLTLTTAGFTRFVSAVTSEKLVR